MHRRERFLSSKIGRCDDRCKLVIGLFGNLDRTNCLTLFADLRFTKKVNCFGCTCSTDTGLSCGVHLGELDGIPGGVGLVLSLRCFNLHCCAVLLHCLQACKQ